MKTPEGSETRAAEPRAAEQRADRPTASRLRTAANEARQPDGRGNGRGPEGRPASDAKEVATEVKPPVENKPVEAKAAASNRRKAAVVPAQEGKAGQPSLNRSRRGWTGSWRPRRGRHSIGNTGAQNQRNGATTLDLVELKDMSIQALNQTAKDLGVPGAAGLRKQELIFKILQTQAEKSGLIFPKAYWNAYRMVSASCARLSTTICLVLTTSMFRPRRFAASIFVPETPFRARSDRRKKANAISR